MKLDLRFQTEVPYPLRAGIRMSQITIEFPLGRQAVEITDTGELILQLGNGVTLRTSIPSWVKGINDAKLQLVMEIEGSPPRAESSKAPIE